MDEMREIGGYMEMEPLCGASVLHKEEIALNSGRNALVWLYMLRKDSGKPIRKLRIPYYLCGSVASICEQYEIPYRYYNIDEHFEPIVADDLAEDEWLYIVNYYGQHSNKKISNWKLQYGNIIVDNAQSYYQEPVSNVDTIYTCRKFFGVSDGAFLHTADDLKAELAPEQLYPQERAVSYDHMRFLLGRFERTANEFYADFRENENRLSEESVMGMSSLTENLLHGIRYSEIAMKRESNWTYLEYPRNWQNKSSAANNAARTVYVSAVDFRRCKASKVSAQQEDLCADIMAGRTGTLRARVARISACIGSAPAPD